MTTTPIRTRTAEDFLAVVLGLRRVVRRRLRAALDEPPLRGAQLELLQLVEAEPGVGVAAAARSLHLAGNSVSTLVNQLVEADLLRRAVDPDDRRAARLYLTDAAAQRMARWRDARTRLVEEALDRLSPGEVTAVTAALPALRRLLEEVVES